jgi:hypothetical protein
MLHLRPYLQHSGRSGEARGADHGDGVVEEHLVAADLHQQGRRSRGEIMETREHRRHRRVCRIVPRQVLTRHPQQALPAALQVELTTTV